MHFYFKNVIDRKFSNFKVTECKDKGNSILPWVQYGEKCYYASSDSASQYLTWQSAEAYCKQNGGFLVSIHSRNELNFLTSKVIIRVLNKIYL